MNIITILLKFLNERYYNNDISLSLLLLNFDGMSAEKSVLNIFNVFILNNGLIHEGDREKAIQMFLTFQKFKYGIMRLQHCYRSKKCKLYDVDTDLNLTPLSTYKDADKISLIENNTKYTFAIVDLIKIINNALTSSEYMAVNVHHPRNPYTNKEFSSHNMYNIMLKLQTHKSYITLKSHIISYFQQNLDLKNYYENNRTFLKKIAVKQYIETEDTMSIFQYVCERFEDYPDHTHIVIDLGWKNKDDIINKVKPMLYYYLLLQQFSESDELTIKYQVVFLNMLKDFTKKNPKFGRIIYKRRSSTNINRSAFNSNISSSFTGIFTNSIFDAHNSMLDISHNEVLFSTSNPFNRNDTLNDDSQTPIFSRITPSINFTPSDLFPLQIPNTSIHQSSSTILPPLEIEQASASVETSDNNSIILPSENEGLPSLEEWVNTTLTNTGECKEEEEETSSIITQIDKDKEQELSESQIMLSPVDEETNTIENDVSGNNNIEESDDDLSFTLSTDQDENIENVIDGSYNRNVDTSSNYQDTNSNSDDTSSVETIDDEETNNIENEHYDEYDNISDATTTDTD
jgi:hypothetical protein